MVHSSALRCTAFAGERRLATGPLAEVAIRVKAALGADPSAPLLTFDDASGRVIDLDLRGSDADVLARLGAEAGTGPAGEARERGRGRPKLGVVAREVTLLPRHWDWLAEQPGGASQALRRLVEDARRADNGRSRSRAAQAAAYGFMAAMAGDRQGFEEASRALFAGDVAALRAQSASWPADIREHVLRLLEGEAAPGD